MCPCLCVSVYVSICMILPWLVPRRWMGLCRKQAHRSRCVGDVDELLLGALLQGLQRRHVPGRLRGMAALPVNNTSSHLFAPYALRSCTNHPTENKTNAGFPISPARLGIAAIGAPKMRKMEKQSCSLTHPARHRGWSWSNESGDGEE